MRPSGTRSYSKRIHLNKWTAADQDPEGDDDDNEEAGKPGGGEDASSSTGLPELPKEHIPVIVTTYRRICAAVKSYRSPICVFLTFAPSLYHFHSTYHQAMAFPSKYHKLRVADVLAVREVGYNFARTIHRLGLYPHAAKHYERVVEMAENAGASCSLQLVSRSRLQWCATP
ncbi:hypothetical protein CVT26_005775 [Gymnopilus dilepis]|uniref:Uncharacterized protein n=1 Tax=Gymnopilus dilepis TaxID=231916 RepID=A0A409VPM0_9AGAR|nr:hypothetical protein CVT26_005775 [Gymnopilus dilepis]